MSWILLGQVATDAMSTPRRDRGSMALYPCYKPDHYGCVLGIVSSMAHIVGRAYNRARHSFGHIWQDGQSVVTLLGEHKELTSTGMLAWGCFIMAQPFSPAYVPYVKLRRGNIGWGGRFVS